MSKDKQGKLGVAGEKNRCNFCECSFWNWESFLCQTANELPGAGDSGSLGSIGEWTFRLEGCA